MPFDVLSPDIILQTLSVAMLFFTGFYTFKIKRVTKNFGGVFDLLMVSIIALIIFMVSAIIYMNTNLFGYLAAYTYSASVFLASLFLLIAFYRLNKLFIKVRDHRFRKKPKNIMNKK